MRSPPSHYLCLLNCELRRSKFYSAHLRGSDIDVSALRRNLALEGKPFSSGLKHLLLRSHPRINRQVGLNQSRGRYLYRCLPRACSSHGHAALMCYICRAVEIRLYHSQACFFGRQKQQGSHRYSHLPYRDPLNPTLCQHLSTRVLCLQCVWRRRSY